MNRKDFLQFPVTSLRPLRGLWPALLLFLLLAGCASEQPMELFEPEAPAEEAPLMDNAMGAPAPSAPVLREQTNIGSPPDQARSPRKIEYRASIELLVTNRRRTIKEVIGFTASVKGYIERIYNNTITIRVPVEDFESSYEKLLAFGKVLGKSVSANDITDQYRSTELRLKIARATRKRLLALLNRAGDEDDKLALLEQIERITIEIQDLEVQMKVLSTRVRYSTITLQLKTPDEFSGYFNNYEARPFLWIRALAAQNTEMVIGARRLEFVVPEGMIHLSKRRAYWSAESGDKVVLRAGSIDNDPKGDSGFWVEAIRFRKKDDYRSIDISTHGDYQVLRMLSFDDNPRVYYLGVKVDDKALKLVETDFPSVELEKAWKERILDSIKAGEQ